MQKAPKNKMNTTASLSKMIDAAKKIKEEYKLKRDEEIAQAKKDHEQK